MAEYQPRLIRSCPFTQMPNTIIEDNRLSLADKGIASVLYSRPNGWVYHTEYLTSFTSNGIDAVKASLKRLESFGYIERTKATDEKGRIIGTDIRLVDSPQVENPSKGKSLQGKIHLYNNTELNNNTDSNKTPYIPQGGAEEDEPTELTLEFGSTDSVKKTDNVTAKKSATKPSSPVTRRPPSPREDGFEVFWRAYPKCERKIGKAKCREMWKSRNLSEVKHVIMFCLEQDKKTDSWTKDGGKWIPLPATWLNRKRYEDVDESEVATEEKVSWAAITFEEFQNFNLSEEWKSWKDSGCMPSRIPAWAKRTEKWVSENTLNIVDAVKL